MQRIPRIDPAEAPARTTELLAAVRKQMGTVPNIVATLAQSGAALGGYLGFSGALAGGKLSGKLREQIALAVAGANRCDYCASVHTAVGGKLGVGAEELDRNLHGLSGDAKVQGALRLATRIVATRGHVTDEDLAAAHRAGFGHEEIVEIVANTVLNIFTNYFNHAAGTDIDFPHVQTAAVAAA